MLDITDEQFETVINQAMDELPEQHIKGLKNVAITFEDEPSAEQREKLKLSCHQSLYGLYEGIPLTKRNGNYSMVLPDKITIFKFPILQSSRSMSDIKQQVKHTLWHEIAHYYGLDHDQIHKLENNWVH